MIKHFLIAILCFGFFAIEAQAASVGQVKGKRVLINLEGDDFSPSSQVFVVDANGKRIGLVKITSVKGSRAVGNLVKGRATAGASIQRGGSRASAPAPSDTSESSTVVRSGRSKLGGGILLGYGMQTMSLTAQHVVGAVVTSEATELKGSAISIKGFMDYQWTDSFNIRAAFGLEPFKATGSTRQLICNNGTSKNCEVSFNYVGMEGALQYNVLNGPTRGWIGLGYSFLIEMGKSVNIPNLQSEGKTNQMLLIGGGVDLPMGQSSYIPIVLEYGMFPGSSNVEASAIFLRTGYAFSF